jgi:beta-mannosidase
MIMIHEGRQKTDLTGIWQYFKDLDDTGEAQGFYKEEYDTSAWKTIGVPCNFYKTEIGDFFGTVWLKREFTVGAVPDGRAFLRFEAIDYDSDVWLNGAYLGFHEGMFNPIEYDVTNILRTDGSNTLIVRDGAPRDPAEYVNCHIEDGLPVQLSQDYYQHQAVGITQIKGHMVDAHHRPGAKTKFRQDGTSGGIWGEVDLVYRPDVFIEYCRIFSESIFKKDWLGDGKDKPTGDALAALDVTINNTTRKPVACELKAVITASNFESDCGDIRKRKIVLTPGRTTVKLSVIVKDAKLWWTWDHGYPHLYNLRLSLLDDSVDIRFGIKDIKYYEETGELYLNGKKIFLRGMRYISTLWMSESNIGLWKPDFDKMVKMNINSIRIGSHVERDGVYKLCDEIGLLVWQVFPLHYCVSDSDDLISRASDMMRDMGMMLANHACIGMWSVYKEPEIYTLPGDKPNTYFKLCRILQETLKTIDPTRWVHLGDYREGTQNLMTGNCQPLDVEADEWYLEPHIVEFGASAIPCRETLETFIPKDKLWPIDWDTWEYWGLCCYNTFKNGKMKLPTSLDGFIEDTQQYAAQLVKGQIEYCRQHKYRPVSTMYLYYWSDACAMIGSGLLDYYRRKYRAYDSMQMVYTPVLISVEPCIKPYYIGAQKCVPSGKTFTARVWVVNDHYKTIKNAKVSWKIVREGTNECVAKRDIEIDLLPDSAEVPDHIVWPVPENACGKYRIAMNILGEDGEVLSENFEIITVV